LCKRVVKSKLNNVVSKTNWLGKDQKKEKRNQAPLENKSVNRNILE